MYQIHRNGTATTDSMMTSRQFTRDPARCGVTSTTGAGGATAVEAVRATGAGATDGCTGGVLVVTDMASTLQC